MKSITPSFTGLALAATLAISPAAFAAEVIGINSAVKGDVTVQTGDAEVRPAVVSDQIHLQDAVNTSLSSTLQITLKDQTTFTVGPNCDLVIDKFVYDPAKANNTLSATVTKGMFRFMSGSISKSNPDAVTINSPTASLGIRGTIVEGVVGPQAAATMSASGNMPSSIKIDMNGASIFTLRGPGANKLGNNNVGRMTVTNQGGSVDVSQVGQSVYVANATTPPVLISADNDETLQSFSDQLRTLPNTGPDTMAFNVSSSIPNMAAPASATTASASGAAVGSKVAGSGLNLGLGAIIAGGAGLAVVIASGGDSGSEENDVAVSN